MGLKSLRCHTFRVIEDGYAVCGSDVTGFWINLIFARARLKTGLFPWLGTSKERAAVS